MSEIRWYKLGHRNEFIESQIPQQYLSFDVEGKRVRIDISVSTSSDGVTDFGINVVYDGYVLPSRLRGPEYTYQLDNRYGVYEDINGLISLGVMHES